MNKIYSAHNVNDIKEKVNEVIDFLNSQECKCGCHKEGLLSCIKCKCLTNYLSQETKFHIHPGDTSECFCVKPQESKCTKCNSPFLPHDHKHITKKGIYHTNCYGKTECEMCKTVDELAPSMSYCTKHKYSNPAKKECDCDLDSNLEHDEDCKYYPTQPMSNDSYPKAKNQPYYSKECTYNNPKEEVRDRKLIYQCLGYCIHRKTEHSPCGLGVSLENLERLRELYK